MPRERYPAPKLSPRRDGDPALPNPGIAAAVLVHPDALAELAVERIDEIPLCAHDVARADAGSQAAARLLFVASAGSSSTKSGTFRA